LIELAQPRSTEYGSLVRKKRPWSGLLLRLRREDDGSSGIAPFTQEVDAMATSAHDIASHPDILEMRQRYDEIAERPIARWSDGVMLLAGLFLAMSPWVVGFTGHAAMMISCLMSGIALCVLAIGFATAYGHFHGLAWVAAVIGLWAMVSSWVVDGPTPDSMVISTAIITGGIGLLCALALMSQGTQRWGR
jgi:multisubunit Na+/H+ antiporter MnhB subunit